MPRQGVCLSLDICVFLLIFTIIKLLQMKKVFFTLIFFSIVLFSNAQSPAFEWADGMGGTFDDVGNSITVDASGNVYTIGSFFGTVDFDPGAGIVNITSLGGYDIFISKIDDAGNFVWAKNIGGSLNDYGLSIVLDEAGNIYSTGSFQGTADFDPGLGVVNLISNGGDDIFISKLDSFGNFIWAQNTGGNLNDIGNSISVDRFSNVYTTGSFQDTVDFDPGVGMFNLSNSGSGSSYDLFFLKLDVLGNFVWAKSIGSTSYDSGICITVDSSCNVYSTGFFAGIVDFNPGPGIFNLFSSGVGDLDIFISKLDISGNFVWAKSMIGGDSFLRGGSIVLDEFDNVYTTGYFSDTVDFDPSLGMYNLISSGGLDVFISKLDSAGNFVWAKKMGGTFNDIAVSIALDSLNNVYTTGWFQGISDFDPDAGIVNLTSIGGGGTSDIFISKLDVSGNFVWAKNIGGNSNDYANSIIVNLSGNVYTTGSFSGVADFDPSTGIFNLNSVGGKDIFVNKLNQSIATEMQSESIKNSINIFPNPTSGSFNVFIPKPIKNGSIEIYNNIGELVLIKEIISQQNSLELKNQADGFYIIKVINDGEVTLIGKILKN